MAGFFSEVTARLGVDTTAFKRGMTEAAAAADKTAGGIARSFGARNIGRTLATAIGLNLQSMADKLVQPFRESAESAQRIAEYSEQAANSVEKLIEFRRTDLQNLEAMERKLEKMFAEGPRAAGPGLLERFFSGGSILGGGPLGALSVFFDKSQERAAEAGAKFSADTAKLNEQIIRKREEINKRAYDAELKALMEIADLNEREKKAAELVAKFRRDEQIKSLPIADRLYELRKEQAEVEKEIAFLNDQVAGGITLTELGNRRLLELEQRRADIQEQIKDDSKEIADTAKKLARSYYEAADAMKAAQNALSARRADELNASLLELAGGAGTFRQQYTAQEILRLEQQARRQNLFGFSQEATMSQARAQALREGLTGLREDERRPFKSLEEEAKKQTERLTEIAKSLEPQNIQ